MENKKDRNFITYEYKEMTVDADQISLYMDAYENFGWKADQNVKTTASQGKATLHFRRDRKMINKTELTRLQRNFDACMDEIRELEASKKSMATTVSIIIGLIGTAFMAGSVFAVTADTPLMLLSVILAIPGFIGWILPYFVFKAMVRRRTDKVNPLIEAKYDELYEVCEKGSRLLT